MDPGRFLRLKSAIDATLQGADEKALAVDALANAYGTFRAEAALIAAEEGVQEEFDHLFPTLSISAASPGSYDFDPMLATSQANSALSLIARLSGWLEGFVQSARLAAEAEAYAAARLRSEQT